MELRILNRSNNPDPDYATAGAAGIDLRANLEKSLILHPMERTLIPTGLFIQLPQGYEAQIRPRSGLAIKQGLTLVNTPGTIDEDYRGEIKVIMINLSKEAQTIEHGERIAQMVIAAYQKVNIIVVEELDETERGAGGFGSTGV